MNKKLQLDFIDGLNKSFRISLDDPKEDLLAADIEDAMNSVVSLNAIGSNGVDIAGIDGARIVTTTVEVIEF